MVAVWGAFWGWALLYGIGLLGRLLFGKDAMGEGDIMLMRGVGALVGVGPLVVAVGIAVFLGAVHGITMKLVDVGRKSKTGASNEEGDEAPPPAQPIWQNLLIGGILLTCLDVVAFFVPPVGKWLEKAFPDAPGLSDEAWEPPSIQYIPFGPFLAMGTAIVMIWETKVGQMIAEYMRQFGGS
jgi:leader peptidase (prepilin peptidase)/N-methyltransferase